METAHEQALHAVRFYDDLSESQESEFKALEEDLDQYREKQFEAWEEEQRAASVELRHSLMAQAPAPRREQAAEIRRQAIVFLEKARSSFDFIRDDDDGQAEERRIGLFLLLEMYRQTGDFDKADELVPVVGQAMTDMGDIFNESGGERYQRHLNQEKDLIAQRNDSRQFLRPTDEER